MTNAKQWAKALRAWEWAMNALLAESLMPHEREALFCVHTLMRTRASGGQADE